MANKKSIAIDGNAFVILVKCTDGKVRKVILDNDARTILIGAMQTSFGGIKVQEEPLNITLR